MGRLLNHSRTEANVNTKVHEVNGKPFLCLIASQNIPAKKELLYDYGERSKEAIQSHPWLESQNFILQDSKLVFVLPSLYICLWRTPLFQYAVLVCSFLYISSQISINCCFSPQLTLVMSLCNESRSSYKKLGTCMQIEYDNNYKIFSYHLK